jgi:hypothetical protein
LGHGQPLSIGTQKDKVKAVVQSLYKNTSLNAIRFLHSQGLPNIDYPFHDKTIVVTHCGRICLGRKKINFSTVFAGQAVDIKEVHDDIWLVSFCDLGYFDLDTRVLEPLENPFGPKLLPM